MTRPVMGDSGCSGSTPDDLVELGRIVAAHGVHGHVKLQPHDLYSETLRSARIWWMQPPVAPAQGGAGRVVAARAVKVLKCQRHGATWVAQLEGINDRDQAQALKGTTLHLPRSAFPKTEDDEYYWVDLIGCMLYGENALGQTELIGQVADVSDNGAHALLHVARLAQAPALPDSTTQDTSPAAVSTSPVLDARGRPQEVLVPFVAAHVLGVDLAARRIDSNWPADF